MKIFILYVEYWPLIWSMLSFSYYFCSLDIYSISKILEKGNHQYVPSFTFMKWLWSNGTLFIVCMNECREQWIMNGLMMRCSIEQQNNATKTLMKRHYKFFPFVIHPLLPTMLSCLFLLLQKPLQHELFLCIMIQGKTSINITGTKLH